MQKLHLLKLEVIKPGRFNFNVKGGRCEACHEMELFKLKCTFCRCFCSMMCEGKRYNDETLDVRYKGKNIYEVLEMTVEGKALEFFENVPGIKKKLQTLYDVGLGYIKTWSKLLNYSFWW